VLVLNDPHDIQLQDHSFSNLRFKCLLSMTLLHGAEAGEGGGTPCAPGGGMDGMFCPPPHRHAFNLRFLSQKASYDVVRNICQALGSRDVIGTYFELPILEFNGIL
jgi:hypothetical protein